MPTRKVVSVLIVCLAIVASLWIFQHNSAQDQALLASENATSTLAVSTPRPEIDTSTDWQAVLQNSFGSGTTTVVGGMYGASASGNQTAVSDGEGTLTDQMAKDFFGQYLQLSQGGQDVTADQDTQIAENTLANTAPAQSTAAVYTASNLHISSNSNNDTVLNYFNALNQTEEKYSSSLNGNELDILNNAIQNNDPSQLSQIAPIVTSYQGIIVSLLAMTVPSDAVSLHLALLNAFSNVLDNIQSIQVSFSDPAKSFVAIGQYEKNTTARDTAAVNLEYYFMSKNIQPTN